MNITWLSQLFAGDYDFTRFAFQRALALVYVIAFVAVVHQFIPLLGEKGLQPVPRFVKAVRFRDSPSLFFFWPTDRAFMIFGWLGVVLSFLALTGISEQFGLLVSMLIWAALWAIYLSFVNVGQTFYGFGWETMLLESGFLAIFLGDVHTAVPAIMIWLVRWVLFRNMFGAGLIKLRVDPCWRDLTCLSYHYETQPMPNPLSWFFHWSPHWFQKLGVAFNHLVELIVPVFYFFTGPIAALAGLLTIIFQGMLMVSGNFAFLNFLTIVLSISTFDNATLSRIFPYWSATASMTATQPPVYIVLVAVVFLLVSILSLRPIMNLFTPYQMMNSSFDPLHLVNTYGAFGSITRQRNEVIIEGTDDEHVTTTTTWKEYGFIGKPGDLSKMPPQIAPYHLRLDWLMWFAAMRPASSTPWFMYLLVKLLQGDAATLSLLKDNPFPDHPPRYVRALLYHYQFTTAAERKQTHQWWKRTLLGTYFPAIGLENVRGDQSGV